MNRAAGSVASTPSASVAWRRRAQPLEHVRGELGSLTGARSVTTSSMSSVSTPPLPQLTITPNIGSRKAVTSSSVPPACIFCT